MISFCSQFARANGQMDKVLAFRSNVPRFDSTASAHTFYHLCKINNISEFQKCNSCITNQSWSNGQGTWKLSQRSLDRSLPPPQIRYYAIINIVFMCPCTNPNIHRLINQVAAETSLKERKSDTEREKRFYIF